MRPRSRRACAPTEAFEAKDELLLRTVWPSLTDKQFRELAGNLQAAQSIQVTLNCTPAQIGGSMAVETCQQVPNIKAEGAVHPLNNSVT
jgi:hypothetical protein